jgi:hypothetical protein
LAYCLALSTLTVAILLAVFDWRYLWDHAGPVPRPLDVLLPPVKDRLEPEPAEDPVTDERTLDEVEERSDLAPRASTDAAETADEPEKVATPPTADAASDEEREIDWQAALERASADTVEAHGTPDSLHPAFDELRRIAAAKYAPPHTGKLPPIWENVEDDIYGRKILRHGDCFRVIDDMNVGNQYAFETFEKYLVFCEWRGEGRQEFPWIETIVARYPYLREPDGGLAAIDKD